MCYIALTGGELELEGGLRGDRELRWERLEQLVPRFHYLISVGLEEKREIGVSDVMLLKRNAKKELRGSYTFNQECVRKSSCLLY